MKSDKERIMEQIEEERRKRMPESLMEDVHAVARKKKNTSKVCIVQ